MDQEKKLKQTLKFLEDVRKDFAGDQGGYMRFLQLLQGMKSGEFNVQQVTEKAESLFQGKDKLLRSFRGVILGQPPQDGEEEEEEEEEEEGRGLVV